MNGMSSSKGARISVRDYLNTSASFFTGADRNG